MKHWAKCPREAVQYSHHCLFKRQIREAPVRISFNTFDPVLGWGICAVTSWIPFQAGFVWCYYPRETCHTKSSIPSEGNAAPWCWGCFAVHEAALISSTEPLTQCRITGLEPDQEPLVNGIALERGVLWSLSRANEQDLCLSALFERGWVLISAENQVTRQLCTSPKAQSLCRTQPPKVHKLCDLMIRLCIKQACSLASQCKLICL